jgi:RNA polymerase sigma-70 factor, ECF subfamily
MNPGIEPLWHQVSPRLRRFIRARVGDVATAEDILQGVFLKLQQRVEEMREPAKMEAWLFLAARNAIIDHYRTAKSTSELPDSLAGEVSPAMPGEIEELHAKLCQIIERLPADYRQAFVLTAFEGFSQEELAKHLGISVSGAKSRVQRARARLKTMLLEFCHREFSRTPGQPCPRGLMPVIPATKAARKINSHAKPHV